jgi:hypothetical protein
MTYELPGVGSLIALATSYTYGITKTLTLDEIGQVYGLQNTTYYERVKHGRVTEKFLRQVCSKLQVPLALFTQFDARYELQSKYEILREAGKAPEPTYSAWVKAEFSRQLNAFHRQANPDLRRMVEAQICLSPSESSDPDIRLVVGRGDDKTEAAGADRWVGSPSAPRPAAAITFVAGEAYRIVLEGPRGFFYCLVEDLDIPGNRGRWTVWNEVSKSQIGVAGRCELRGTLYDDTGRFRLAAIVMPAIAAKLGWTDLKPGTELPDHLLRHLAPTESAQANDFRVVSLVYEVIPLRA